MKKIEAIIRPERFNIVTIMLQEMGINGMNISEIRGHGTERHKVQIWRGREYRAELHPKIKLEIVVTDEEMEPVVNKIIEEARTGAIGDGKIFVTHVNSAYRIRTGETGHHAITNNGRVVSLSPKELTESLETVEKY